MRWQEVAGEAKVPSQRRLVDGAAILASEIAARRRSTLGWGKGEARL